MNLVECWFSLAERQAIHRGTYTSVKPVAVPLTLLVARSAASWLQVRPGVLEPAGAGQALLAAPVWVASLVRFPLVSKV